jgi:hypothetical protein
MGEKPFFVLLEDHPFRRNWSMLMMVLLIYVAIWVPFMICMMPINNGDMMAYEFIDKVVDFFFLIDMIV